MFNSNLCITCKYSITDPVCERCHIKHTLMLLKDLKVNPIITEFINKKLKPTTSKETLNDTECILCKKANVNLCYYCYSENLIRILRELNFTEDLIENFEYNAIEEDESIFNQGDRFEDEISLEDEIISEIEIEDEITCL